MPGINIKNVHCILNTVRDIAELCTLTQERLREVLRSEQNARALWEFLHLEQKQAEPAVTTNKSTKSTRTGRFQRKK